MSLDSLLKRYFSVVVVLLLGLAAYFQAAGATQLLGAAFVMPASSGAPIKPVQALTPSVSGHKSAEPIIERNPFDSTTSLKGVPVTLPTGPTEPDIKDPLSAPVCDGVNAFIITESPNDPTWSVAALQGPGEPHPKMRRVGAEVGGKQVAYIGFNPRENSPAVWLTSGPSLCEVLLFKKVAAAAAPAAPSAGVAQAVAAVDKLHGGPPTVPSDIATKIQKISDTEFQVDRAVVDKILENQAELMKSARIVPEQKDGKVVGIRLFGVRPDTLLGTLGLQNGDRLEAINGFNMGSPEKALEAYARLRTASSLKVTVTRRGAPMTIDYNIK